jgi:surfeit locus 1 family protein
MGIRLFGVRPQLWPTLITAPAVLVAFALGVWQVHRLQWKSELVAERQAHRDAPALIGLPARYVPAEHDFRRMVVRGRFRHDQEFYLAARSHAGRPGFHVLTPLAVGDAHVLVNRGWVPPERKAPQTREAGQSEGLVEVTGYLRQPPVPGWFVPANRPEQNVWFHVDLPAMAAAQNIDNLKSFVIEAAPASVRGGYPVSGVTRFELPNDHLQYAITWFAMAVIGVVVYLLYHRRRASGTGAASPS